MYFKFLVIHSQYKSTPVICSLSLSFSLSHLFFSFLRFRLTKRKLIFLLPIPYLHAVFLFSHITMAFTVVPFLVKFLCRVMRSGQCHSIEAVLCQLRLTVLLIKVCMCYHSVLNVSLWMHITASISFSIHTCTYMYNLYRLVSLEPGQWVPIDG